MYAYGEPSSIEEESPGTPHTSAVAETFMTNTSRVPIFRQDACESEYPEFFEKVKPLAQEAVLRPGDLLMLPPGWWHAMKGEGEGPGWSISMWY